MDTAPGDLDLRPRLQDVSCTRMKYERVGDAPGPNTSAVLIRSSRLGEHVVAHNHTLPMRRLLEGFFSAITNLKRTLQEVMLPSVEFSAPAVHE